MKTKILFKRFLRGFVAGAVATMITVAIPNYQNWGDVQLWFINLGIAGIIGGIAGGLLAMDKALRWKEGE